MKTHELISLAEYISKIMAHYPNKSVEYALDDILNLLETRNSETSLTNKKEPKTQTQINSRLSKSIKDSISLQYVFGGNSKPDDETSESLSNLSLAELKEIATKMGIRTSSRQNKGVLVMNISKTMERRKIDSTIKDKDKDN
ncbi:TPA: hypothetical protein ACPZW1_001211 [Enterobacter hormaechei subsp. hoffmannii]|uniref:hypothetical protein n=1 Tax=Enterobacter hormaechei TaxID=158836 RepID=UPI0018C2693C|nr:hypothetical protein [Enterobacter hormaechei]MBF9793489.1 hypothetical protein [Enterobacter hormaechei]MBN4835272.1 hypothetical protein [Enterobacter hormaechei]MDU7017968.1 hypothetical protein [Enterobacter sp.]